MNQRIDRDGDRAIEVTVAAPFPDINTRERLTLEPTSPHYTPSLQSEIGWLYKEIESGSSDFATNPLEDQVERILRGTVVLKTANPEASLADCLHTAILWERG